MFVSAANGVLSSVTDTVIASRSESATSKRLRLAGIVVPIQLLYRRIPVCFHSRVSLCFPLKSLLKTIPQPSPVGSRMTGCPYGTTSSSSNLLLSSLKSHLALFSLRSVFFIRLSSPFDENFPPFKAMILRMTHSSVRRMITTVFRLITLKGRRAKRDDIEEYDAI
jgi:hypothetical protein